MTVSQTVHFLLFYRLNVIKCYFSAKGEEGARIRYVYGAGRHAGLTVVLNTMLLEYFAPLEPMYGIWVSHTQTLMLSP